MERYIQGGYINIQKRYNLIKDAHAKKTYIEKR